MEFLWLLVVPFLALASWQDLKKHEIEASLAYGIFAVAFASIILFRPLPYDFVSTSLAHGLLLFAALAIGWFFEGTKAWLEGDTLVFAAAAFASIPTDVVLFSVLSLAVIITCTVPQYLRKGKISAGIPIIALAFIVYNLIVSGMLVI